MVRLKPEVAAGQAVYTPRVLRIYDLLVLGLSNRFIWKCPTPRILELYNRRVSDNHLDVGVGTGYFLAHCRFPSDAPRLALMDINEHCLHAAARRVAPRQVEALQRNILAPISYDGAPFASIGLNYVLHCLPGDLSEKAIVFDHLRPLLASGGVIFGVTLLSGGVRRTRGARWLAGYYNRRGVFSNQHDTAEGLKQMLASRFRRWSVELVGSAALFTASD